MDFKLIWTESAIDDLGAIVRNISSQSGPEVARKIGFEIDDTAQILKRFPEAGSILPEKDSASWRKLVVRSWKIATSSIMTRRSHLVLVCGMPPAMRLKSNSAKQGSPPCLRHCWHVGCSLWRQKQVVVGDFVRSPN